MDTKKTFRKILFAMVWLLIGSGMLILLIAAMRKQGKEICKGYTISIKGKDGDNSFLDKTMVANLVLAAADGQVKGRRIADFHLLQVEEMLEDNNWIKKAQLYFDNQEILHVKVEERIAVARIFTVNERSFYFDAEGTRMKLSDKGNIDVTVFTGFPEKADSAFTANTIAVASFIDNDPFWKDQVAQINIVPCGNKCYEYEMIPVVGNHVIRLGNGSNIKDKMDRLMIFYQQVLSKTGFSKYKSIDLRFDRQIAAAKSENPKVDSVALRKSIEKLIAEVKQAEKTSEVNAAKSTAIPVQQTKKEKPLNMMTADDISPATISNPVPLEKPNESKPATAVPPVEKPKAVMQKRTGQ